jgi:DMSO/TMAO reductase YedYZ molybdopterin-dependent catalytic subunit
MRNYRRGQPVRQRQKIEEGRNRSHFRGWAEEESGPVLSPLAIWYSVRKFAMHSRVRKAALMVLAGVIVLALVGLVWATETASSETGQDAIQKRPPVSTLAMPSDVPSAVGDSEWSLIVDGLVESPLNLTFDDIVAMPTTTVHALLICVGLPWDPLAEGNWTGVRLGFILDEAGVSPEAVKVAFYADDGFTTDLTVTTAMRDDIILAYERDGEPLAQRQLVVPCKWGYKWIRGLIHIELVDYDFLGFYESIGFSDEANIPGDIDCDGDGFTTADEEYIGTDPLDKCTDDPGVHDAWPLDINVDTYVTVGGDVLPYRGRIGSTGGPPADANWLQRLDINADNYITTGGDVLAFRGMIGEICT